MRRLYFAAMPLVAAAFSQSASAQDAPAPAFDLSAGVTGVSDYRFRGLSQSNKRPAIQATVNVAHKSGLYAGVWSSSISNYVASSSPAEIDLYAGWKKTDTEDNTTFDVGVLYYVYPDSNGATTNFLEPYISFAKTFGKVGAKIGANFALEQRALGLTGDKRGAFYSYSELSAPVGPVTVTGHLGRSWAKNYITFGTRYTDWSLTAAYTRGPATFSLGYVDTNRSLFSYPTGPSKNRNVAKAGVVASVGFAF